jgi:Ser/Thr protein kinase RdoA (MazF antagonist)
MNHGRPYVDQRVVDLEAAARVASSAAGAWGLCEPMLLRRGMNAIFLCGAEVLRVGRATAPAEASHELASVLAGHGVPVAAQVDGHAADLGGFAVTGWHRIDDADLPVDWEAVGEAVARIHALDPSDLPDAYPLPSPTTFPWWDFDTLLDAVAEHIDADALAGLTRTIDAGSGWRDDIGSGAVVCHGDVHPGNVLVTADGPVLIDFDLLCRAAPAWDHAMLTTYATRWGGAPDVYPAFARGYGRSLADDPLTATIASLRNVAATLMRVRAGITDEAARDEAEQRLRFWRGDPDAPQWSAQ